jgi:hypothetical protein
MCDVLLLLVLLQFAAVFAAEGNPLMRAMVASRESARAATSVRQRGAGGNLPRLKYKNMMWVAAASLG